MAWALALLLSAFIAQPFYPAQPQGLWILPPSEQTDVAISFGTTQTHVCDSGSTTSNITSHVVDADTDVLAIFIAGSDATTALESIFTSITWTATGASGQPMIEIAADDPDSGDGFSNEKTLAYVLENPNRGTASGAGTLSISRTTGAPDEGYSFFVYNVIGVDTTVGTSGVRDSSSNSASSGTSMEEYATTVSGDVVVAVLYHSDDQFVYCSVGTDLWIETGCNTQYASVGYNTADSTSQRVRYTGISNSSPSAMLILSFAQASAAETKTVTTSLDAKVKKTGVVKTTSLDAALRKAGLTSTTTLDAAIRATGIERTATADAVLKALGETRTTSLDAALRRQGIELAPSVDAAIQRQALTATTDLDAALQKVSQLITDLDAVLKALGVERTATADAVIKKLGETETVSLDALIQATVELSTDISAYLQKTVGLTTDLEAALQAAVSLTTTFDAHLVSAGAIELTVSLEALLQKLGLSVTALLDAVLMKQGITLTTDVDSLLQKVETLSADLDAIVKAVGVTATTTLDAHLIESGAGLLTVSLDALVQALALTVSTSLDAALQKAAQTLSVDMDGVIKAEGVERTTSLDAALQSAETLVADLDALLQAAGIKIQTDVDALVIRRTTLGVTLDSLLILQQMLTAQLDAVLVYGGASQFGYIDARISILAAIGGTMDIGAATDAQSIDVEPAVDADVDVDKLS